MEMIRYALLACLVCAHASTDALGFSLLSFAWGPGPNTTRNIGSPAPGGATWSAVPTGVPNPFSEIAPTQATTIDIETLITPEVDGLEYSIFNEAFDTWANAAAISNLGKVTDGALLTPAANLGDSESNNGHLGDTRVAAIAYHDDLDPAMAVTFILGNSSTIAGDIIFDANTNWIDDPDGSGDGVDLFTVALHEIGHSLGLGNSDVAGSVMEQGYFGTRRTLHPDDIAGIRAIYGVPEPMSSLLATMAIVALAGFSRGYR